MEGNLKVGDMVWTDQTEEGYKETYGVIVEINKLGDGEESSWDLKVMVNDVGYGSLEDWIICDPVWNDELGAWEVYWG